MPSPTRTFVADLVTRTAFTRTAPASISRWAMARDLQKRACQSHLSRRIAPSRAAPAIRPVSS